MATWSVVVPTNRPERFEAFLNEWIDIFHRHDVTLFVIADLDDAREVKQQFEFSGLEGECWPRRSIEMKYCPINSDMIRSWGIYRAWKSGNDYTLTLDDDTKPMGDLFPLYEWEFERPRPCSPYFSVGSMTSSGKEMRGFPFQQRDNGKVMVQYGGWNGVLDYDAPTQLAGVQEDEQFWPFVMPVPKGAAVTTCIMNAAWRRSFSREMWQLPLLEGRYNRFGDIWSGLLQKKVLDHTDGVMLINGRASVLHERASDPQLNMQREQPGIVPNEGVWEHLRPGRFEYVTASLAHFFVDGDPEYYAYFHEARLEWLALFGAPE